MALTPVPNAITPIPPLNPLVPVPNVTPFTYRDNYTYLRLLTAMRNYITDVLVPEVDVTQNGILEAITVALQAQIDAVNSTIADMVEYVDTETAAAVAEATQIANDAKAYVDSAVAAIINSTIAVTDPVTLEIISDESSDTRELLDTLFADKVIQAVIETGRLSAETMVNTYADTILSSAFAVIGNGTTDDTAAFQSFLNSAATAKTRATIQAGATIKLTASVTIPTGTVLEGNGARIVSAVPGDAGRLLIIQNSNDVLVQNLVVDGDKASYGPPTEQRHNILISNADRVTLRNVKTINAKGDGIYIGDNISGASTDVRLDNVHALGNHRQGLSITAVDGLVVTNGKFRTTAGTLPQSGIDIEPNTDDSIIRGVVMIGVDFDENLYDGLVISLRATPTVEQSGGDYYGISARGNGRHGVYLNNGRNTRFFGGEIHQNGAHGIWLSSSTGGKTEDIEFVGTKITENGAKGLLIDQPFNRMKFIGVEVLNNVGIGLDVLPIGASTDFLVVNSTLGNTGTGTAQTHGIRTGSNLSGLTLANNEYPANATADVSLTDVLDTRNRMDRIASLERIGVASGIVFGARIAADLQQRLIIRADGDLRFGDGTVAPAVRFYRDITTSHLRTGGRFIGDLGFQIGTRTFTSGTGTPEGVVVAPVGSLYTRQDGGALTTLYVKETGAGNTGWVAK